MEEGGETVFPDSPTRPSEEASAGFSGEPEAFVRCLLQVVPRFTEGSQGFESVDSCFLVVSSLNVCDLVICASGSSACPGCWQLGLSCRQLTHCSSHTTTACARKGLGIKPRKGDALLLSFLARHTPHPPPPACTYIITECARKGLGIKPRKGDALLFFSLKPDGQTQDSKSLHAGCPVIKGTKWIATKVGGWVW